jgi:hypothetical protein
MFEDLRKSANENPKSKEESDDNFESYDYSDLDEEQASKQFLGMTSFQRFILAAILFMMTCVFAVFVLVLTGKIYLPFF